MKKNLTLAAAAALALTLGGGTAGAQAKAPARHLASSRTHVAAGTSRDINLLDWVIPGPSESNAPGLGLVTDLIEELMGGGGLLNGG